MPEQGEGAKQESDGKTDQAAIVAHKSGGLRHQGAKLSNDAHKDDHISHRHGKKE